MAYHTTTSTSSYHVYILANRGRRIYVGVTRDLRRRVWEHKEGIHPKSFTSRYGITTLVYAEPFTDIRVAITREKQLKRWPRWRKDRLIDASNPTWADLSAAWDARPRPPVVGPAHPDPDTRACGAPAG